MNQPQPRPSPDLPVHDQRPSLIKLPAYIVYLNWPKEGTGWIHEDDVATAEKLIPSSRVFQRTAFESGFHYLQYGSDRLRVRPTLWMEVRSDGFNIGDLVEVLSLFGKNEPFVGRIAEMRWSRRRRQIRYVVRRRGKPIAHWFVAADMQAVDRRFTFSDREAAWSFRPEEPTGRGEP